VGLRIEIEAVRSDPQGVKPVQWGMDADQPNFFAGPYLDRLAEARDDAGWLTAARVSPETMYLVGRGTAHLMYSEPQPRIAFLTGKHPALRDLDSGRHLLLGRFRDRLAVLVELPLTASPELLPGATFQELRPLAPVLSGDEAGLLAYARALAIWRSRQRYCGVCGSPTVAVRAGHCMRCSNEGCRQEFFPRIDPAIIVLVSDGERALLGRQPSWPPGRYSTIAGFVEPGESLEDAVAREVLEETGVRVSQARYHSSQPWPFPSSLMLGFQATAQPDSLVRVTQELDDARWFTREQIESGSVLLPPAHAISYRLISTWLKGTPFQSVP
jgi:NAD+ diphosphatase